MDKFSVLTSQASPAEVEKRFPLLSFRSLIKIYRRLLRILPKLSRKYYFEKSMAFDHSLFETNPECFIDGYFQSYKYFEGVNDIILQEFQPKEAPDEVNHHLIRVMQVANSVSLHIRRGDYISSAEANKVHGICGLEYYRAAVENLQSRLVDPQYFVFSDDIAWAKENLDLGAGATFVQHNAGSKSYWDLVLMSHCKHNIIANSTFSWWGAWLNQNPDKIVYAPKTWFADSSKNTSDLIPQSWMRI
ncbi:MAG: alpha-1,2-fucosyltransferase [Proteobacteria bacterium]|nr:MAG: alpha-1,2-fucosyltransferase [Pseudomonadota bacterium]